MRLFNPFKPLTKRHLTLGEKNIAQSVFAHHLVVDDIQLCTHSLMLKGYAMSPNGNIYFNKLDLPADFAQENLMLRSWLVHELAHVWQIQQGLKIIRRALFDRRYNYKLIENKDFFKYGIEQQASIIQDFYIARERSQNCKNFETCIPFL